MGNSNINIPSELGSLIYERQKIWAEVDKSRSHVTELSQLSSHVANCAPAELEAALSSQGTPPAELVAALALLKNEIESIDKLKAEMASCRMEIEQIQSRDRTVIIAIIVVVLLLIIIVIAKVA
jgi:hypothetical protein